MIYFSYGSNMSTKRMIERVESAKLMGTAKLLKHKLKFHKSSKDGSAKCDAYFTGRKTDLIFGAVYKIDPKDREKLDRCEGNTKGYEVKSVEIVGSADEQIHAFTYYATDINPTLKPYTWYKEHVIRGAMEVQLANEYIRDHMEYIEAIEDMNHARQEREMSIYR